MFDALAQLLGIGVRGRLGRLLRRLRKAASASEAIQATSALLAEADRLSGVGTAKAVASVLLEAVGELARIRQAEATDEVEQAADVVAEAAVQAVSRVTSGQGGAGGMWLTVAEVGVSVAGVLPTAAAYLLAESRKVLGREMPPEAVRALAVVLAQRGCADDEALEVYVRSVELGPDEADPVVLGLLEERLRIGIDDAAEAQTAIVDYNKRLANVADFALRNMAWHAVGTGEEARAQEFLEELIDRGSAGPEEMAAAVALAYRRGESCFVLETLQRLSEHAPVLAEAAAAALRAEQLLFADAPATREQFLEAGEHGLETLQRAAEQVEGREKAGGWNTLARLLPKGWELLRRLAVSVCLCLYAGGQRKRGYTLAHELVAERRDELVSHRLAEIAVLGSLAEDGPDKALTVLESCRTAGEDLVPASAAMLTLLAGGRHGAARELAERVMPLESRPGQADVAFAAAEASIAQGYWRDAAGCVAVLEALAADGDGDAPEPRSQLVLSASERLTAGDRQRVAACAHLVRAAVEACQSVDPGAAVRSAEQSRQLAAQLPSYLCDWRDVLRDWAELRWATLVGAERREAAAGVVGELERRWGPAHRLQLARSILALGSTGHPTGPAGDTVEGEGQSAAERWLSAARAYAVGDQQTAERLSKGLVEAHGSRPNAWAGHALLLIGDMAFARGEFPEARDAYAACLDHKPSLAGAVQPRMEALGLLGGSVDSHDPQHVADQGRLSEAQLRISAGLVAWRRREWQRLVEQWEPVAREIAAAHDGEGVAEVVSRGLAEAYARLGEAELARDVAASAEARRRAEKVAYLARLECLPNGATEAWGTGALGVDGQPAELELALLAWAWQMAAAHWDAARRTGGWVRGRWPAAPETWLWEAVQAAALGDWRDFRTALRRARDLLEEFADGGFGAWLGRARTTRPCYGNLERWLACASEECELREFCGPRAVVLQRVHGVVEFLSEFMLFRDGQVAQPSGLVSDLDFSHVPLHLEQSAGEVAAFLAAGGRLVPLWSLAAALAGVETGTEDFDALLIAASSMTDEGRLGIAVGLLARSLIAAREGRYGTARAAAETSMAVLQALSGDGGGADA